MSIQHRLFVPQLGCCANVINRNQIARALCTHTGASRLNNLSTSHMYDAPLSRTDGSFRKTTSRPPKSGTLNVPRWALHVSRREPSATHRLDLLQPHLR